MKNSINHYSTMYIYKECIYKLTCTTSYDLYEIVNSCNFNLISRLRQFEIFIAN